MKTWLKGGLIGGVIGLIISILGFISIVRIIGIKIFNIVFSAIGFGACAIITQCQGEDCMGCIFFGPIINIILGFLIGAIIGLIIQKVKKK